MARTTGEEAMKPSLTPASYNRGPFLSAVSGVVDCNQRSNSLTVNCPHQSTESEAPATSWQRQCAFGDSVSGHYIVKHRRNLATSTALTAAI